MKRTLVLLALLSAIIGANAQAGFSAGIKGGLNLATLEGNNADEVYANRTGYHGGVFANIRLQRLGIQPEIIFSSQGAQLDLSNAEEKFTYVNVPVIFKYYLFDFLNIQAGPQFGIMTSAVVEDANGSVDVEGTYKKTDLTLGLGIGIELPLGLNLECRYNMGMTDINDNPQSDYVINNQVYQVSIGFRFLDVDKD